MIYKINLNAKHYLPKTVLFKKDNNEFTVAMANDTIDYMLGVLSHKDPQVDTYKKAKSVFSAIKSILENKQPSKLKKDDIISTINVIEEIKNMSATTEAEKEYNARCALICKWFVDGFTDV